VKREVHFEQLGAGEFNVAICTEVEAAGRGIARLDGQIEEREAGTAPGCAR